MDEKLVGQFVSLVPLVEAHRETLCSLAQDDSIWTYMPTQSMGESFHAWFDKALASQATGQQKAFVVWHHAEQAVVGSTRFYNIDHEHKRLSIGYTWYTQQARGTQVNPEAKLLLLQTAFETLAFNRVEFQVDSRNSRSCKAIEKLGAMREGVLRKHMIVQDAYVRDTVVFSLIIDQWPGVKQALQRRLTCEDEPLGRDVKG